MKWRTRIKSEELPKKVAISHNSKIVLMGSCFSSNIGAMLKSYKFDAEINPFGISYNPYSILQHIRYLNDSLVAMECDLFLTDKGYSHFDFHGDLSSKEKKEGFSKLDDSINKLRNLIRDTDVVFLTYGTAFVYNHHSHGIVNNCHKVNAELFEKQLLNFNTLQKIIRQSILILKSLNREVKIIFCLSPIRHIKNGIVDDRRSKSLLLASIHNVIEKHSNCFYFPSYEILVDDLRDYRFYERDLIHPNAQAIEYIWDHFVASFMSEDTKELLVKVKKINKQVSHRAINPYSKEHQLFEQNLRKKLKNMEDMGLDYSDELIALDTKNIH